MSLADTIKKVALLRYPQEMVGYVKGGIFTELKNVSTTPTERYQLSLRDKIFMSEGLEKILVHSHPILDNHPSKADTLAQRATGLEFWIVGTDGKTTTEIRKIDE